MERIKCITFDKEAQDSLPQHIKDKMKADRDKARQEQLEVNKLALGDVMKSVCHYKPCLDQYNGKCLNGRMWENCNNRQTVS